MAAMHGTSSRGRFATGDNATDDVVSVQASDGEQDESTPGERGGDSVASSMAQCDGPMQKDSLDLKQFPREFARKRSPEIAFR